MKKNIFYSLIFSGVLAIVSAEAVGQGIDIKSRITPVNRPVSTAQSVENLNEISNNVINDTFDSLVGRALGFEWED